MTLAATHNDFFRALLIQAHCWMLPDGTALRASQVRAQHAMTIQTNLEGLGFAFTPDALRRLTQTPQEVQADLYGLAWPVAKDMLGVRHHQAFYPNFPAQVMEASDTELLLNALTHYVGSWFGVRLIPDYPVERRPPLREKTADPIPVDVVTVDEAKAIWQRWIQSPVTWSPGLRSAAVAGLHWVRARHALNPTEAGRLRLAIPNRENKAVIAAELLALPAQGDVFWPLTGSTVTDALRTAVTFSGGDPSLATMAPLASFKRAARRALMEIVEAGCSTSTAVEDVFSRREAWLRLGERLHPGEMNAFPNAQTLFERLRNGQAPMSFMAELEGVLVETSGHWTVAKFCTLMGERPGLAARHLRRVLLWAGAEHQDQVLRAFEDQAQKVSTSILLNIAHAFTHQRLDAPRAVLPKGAIARMMLTPNPAAMLPEDTARQAVKIAQDALVARFSLLPALGKVYLDPALNRVPTPYAMRSSSRALHTLPRGARVPMDPKAEVTRLFVWWNETGPDGRAVDRTDLDISCVVFDENYQAMTHCAFNDLRGAGLTHSGDFVSAPQGAAEFIDIEHNALPKGSRYIGMVVTCYTGQHYSELPECFAGWMSRRSPTSGEIFEPRTVTQRMDLTCDSKAVMPMVVDLKTREFIWLDMPYEPGFGYNAVSGHLSELETRIKQLAALSRPTMGELFALHVRARGEQVATLDAADVVISLSPQMIKPGICAMDEAISAQWMGEAGCDGWQALIST